MQRKYLHAFLVALSRIYIFLEHPIYRGIRTKIFRWWGLLDKRDASEQKVASSGRGKLWTGSGVEYRTFFYRTAVYQWWGSNRIEWRSKGGSGGWSVQSARRNDRLSARYVPSRYHEPHFTNVVHCYVLERYWRSTLLAARTRARPPLVTYVVVVDVGLTAVVAWSFVHWTAIGLFEDSVQIARTSCINGEPSRRDASFIFFPFLSFFSIYRDLVVRYRRFTSTVHPTGILLTILFLISDKIS